MSDELRERFGDIYVDTVFQDSVKRIGYLRRKSDKAVLTYHEVTFDARGIRKMGAYHDEIVAGSLLGETIRRSGLLHERTDSEIEARPVPEMLSKAMDARHRLCRTKTVRYTVENEPYVTIEEYYNPEFTPL